MPLLFCDTSGCDFSTSQPPTSSLLQSCPRCGGKRFVSRDHAGPLKAKVLDTPAVPSEPGKAEDKEDATGQKRSRFEGR